MKTPYTDLLANAFNSVQAWRTTCFVLLGVLLFGSVEFVRLASQQTVILVPQGLAQVKNPITLNLGEPFSPDYITRVAEGDAHFLLDWTPDNVEQQYELFAGRLVPAQFAAKHPELIGEANRHREEGESQSFYVIRRSVQGGKVTLSGTLVRSQGGREIFRGPATYIFDYVNAGNSLLQVASVSQPSNDKTAQK